MSNKEGAKKDALCRNAPKSLSSCFRFVAREMQNGKFVIDLVLEFASDRAAAPNLEKAKAEEQAGTESSTVNAGAKVQRQCVRCNSSQTREEIGRSFRLVTASVQSHFLAQSHARISNLRFVRRRRCRRHHLPLLRHHLLINHLSPYSSTHFIHSKWRCFLVLPVPPWRRSTRPPRSPLPLVPASTLPRLRLLLFARPSSVSSRSRTLKRSPR